MGIFSKPNIPPPPPPPPAPDPTTTTPPPVDPTAISDARQRADAVKRRANRQQLTIPLGSVAQGTGLAI